MKALLLSVLFIFTLCFYSDAQPLQVVPKIIQPSTEGVNAVKPDVPDQINKPSIHPKPPKSPNPPNINNIPKPLNAPSLPNSFDNATKSQPQPTSPDPVDRVRTKNYHVSPPALPVK